MERRADGKRGQGSVCGEASLTLLLPVGWGASTSVLPQFLARDFLSVHFCPCVIIVFGILPPAPSPTVLTALSMGSVYSMYKAGV